MDQKFRFQKLSATWICCCFGCLFTDDHKRNHVTFSTGYQTSFNRSPDKLSFLFVFTRKICIHLIKLDTKQQSNQCSSPSDLAQKKPRMFVGFRNSKRKNGTRVGSPCWLSVCPSTKTLFLRNGLRYQVINITKYLGLRSLEVVINSSF